MTAVTVGFDIGGTNLRAAAVTVHGEIIDRIHAQSQGTEQSMEDNIVAMTEKLAQRHDVSAVGIAVAGFLDAQREVVRFAPHLPWRDAPLRDRIAARLSIPVTLEHDANSAAIGEHTFGAAQGVDTWVLFSIGTGIGAALTIGGDIYRGSFGTAPELGHVQVVPGGRQCPCGKRGCLERYVSGTALAETATELSGQSGWTGEKVIAAARAGDAVGKQAMSEFTHWLAVGLSMVSDIFDPELIVVGGGVAKNHDVFLDPAAHAAASLVVGAGHRPFPRVLAAQLGADAGIIGAAHLAYLEA